MNVLWTGNSFRLADQIEKCATVAMAVLAKAFRGQFKDAIERCIPFVVGIAQEHSKTGYGGGEFKVARGLRIGMPWVDHRKY